jgi:YaiO family outer membrane protein
MNSESTKLIVWGLAVFAASVHVGIAAASDPDRVAQLGLAPAPSRTANEPATAGMDSRQTGLKRSRGIVDGGGIALDYARGDEGGPVIYGGTRTMPRLGLANSQVVGGLLYRLSGNWFSTIETSVDAASPLPGRGYGLLGQVHRLLPGGWDLSLGLHYNAYESSASPAQGNALEPLALTTGQTWAAHPAVGSASTTTGYALRLNYRYGERNSLGVTYGSGSESDYTRQMLGMYPIDGRQFGLTGEHWLTPDWALNYGVMAQEQTGPYRGQGLRLGLRYRF